MPIPFLETTAPPAAPTAAARRQLPMLALVIVGCEKEPWREGEVAFFPPSTVRWIGRGGEPIEEYASWDRHRPGDPMPMSIGIAGCLHGNSLSRRQATVTASGGDLKIDNHRGCPMFVNGIETTRATVRPGDTIMFLGEVVLLCVFRLPVFPALRHASINHSFGDRDAASMVGEGFEAWRVRDEATGLGRGTDFVLIFGETGTGKTAIARLIHLASSRADRPFRMRNSVNFTEELLEAQLFGKNANFPNPGPAVIGALPAASGGTLFLDEIGRLLPRAQGHLLTALEDGRFYTLGDSNPRTTDLRVLGATNQDRSVLQPDFGYRFPSDLLIGPVRERREDIALLARDLLRRRLAKDATLRHFFTKGPSGEMYPNISARLMDFLVRHELRGNMRELDGLLAAAILRSDGDRISMFADGRSPSIRPASISPSSGPTSAEEEADEDAAEEDAGDGGAMVTREAVLAALKGAKGNVSAAAKKLGIQRSKLYRVMRELGIKGAESPEA